MYLNGIMCKSVHVGYTDYEGLYTSSMTFFTNTNNLHVVKYDTKALTWLVIIMIL
jgi:hypothetical protein